MVSTLAALNLYSFETYYLLLCSGEHADGTDVIGVLSQSPLSFDSFSYSLGDVYLLERQKNREREVSQTQV